MESQAALWEDPQCAFRVEWVPNKLDDLRVSVVDALYAVPRGGIEIGAILLGTFDGKLLRVEDFAPIDCEHLTGPSFVLSAKDEAALAAQLAALDGQVVGWLHSHTRSELVFSALDAVLHNKYFPKQWQVAMLLRPAHLQPVRATYFFQNAKGELVAGGSEFTLDPVRAEAAVTVPLSALPANVLAPPRPDRQPKRKPVEEPAPAPVAASAPEPQQPKSPPVEPSLPPPPPLFAQVVQQRRPFNYLLAAIAFLVVSLGGAAFFTRDLWLPNAPEPLRLRASDVDGKLIIRWTPVRKETAGELQITDGAKQTNASLDAAQLARGLFVYSRVSPGETVRLKVGNQQEITNFAGPLPGPTEAALAAEKARAEAEQHVANAKAALASESARSRQLEKKLNNLKKTINQAKQR